MDRYQKTHPEADPCTIQTAKHFVELLCKVSHGHGDGGKASDKTIYQYWRRFFSRWARETCNEIPGQVKATVQNVRHIIFHHIFFPLPYIIFNLVHIRRTRGEEESYQIPPGARLLDRNQPENNA